MPSWTPCLWPRWSEIAVSGRRNSSNLRRPPSGKLTPRSTPSCCSTCRQPWRRRPRSTSLRRSPGCPIWSRTTISVSKAGRPPIPAGFSRAQHPHRTASWSSGCGAPGWSFWARRTPRNLPPTGRPSRRCAVRPAIRGTSIIPLVARAAGRRPRWPAEWFPPRMAMTMPGPSGCPARCAGCSD